MTQVQTQQLLEQPLPGLITSVSYILPFETPYEEWEAIGQRLQQMNGAMKWWLGDWLLYGEQRYGQMYAQALLETGLAYQTLANIASVCGRIEISRRREKLSFSHHEVVAKLPPDEQSRWLFRTEEEDWTVSQLRAELNPKKVKADPPPPPVVVEAMPVVAMPVMAIPDLPIPIDLSSLRLGQTPPPLDYDRLEAWSRQRIGQVWSEEDHLALMDRIGWDQVGEGVTP